MASCVGANGCWNASGMCSDQLKKNASCSFERCSRTLRDALAHGLRHFGRIVDDDVVALGGGLAQRQAQELVDLLEVRAADSRRAGQDQRERQLGVVRVQQDAEQVQDFLGGADAAGEHDDAVAERGRRPRGASRCPA